MTKVTKKIGKTSQASNPQTTEAEAFKSLVTNIKHLRADEQDLRDTLIHFLLTTSSELEALDSYDVEAIACLDIFLKAIRELSDGDNPSQAVDELVGDNPYKSLFRITKALLKTVTLYASSPEDYVWEKHFTELTVDLALHLENIGEYYDEMELLTAKSKQS